MSGGKTALGWTKCSGAVSYINISSPSVWFQHNRSGHEKTQQLFASCLHHYCSLGAISFYLPFGILWSVVGALPARER